MPEKQHVRAVFPGSFDPITNGHLDVIKRGIKIFDELIVGVGDSPAKEYLFSGDERLAMIRELLGSVEGVRVERFTGLTVEYVREKGASVILRGMRNLSDVEYEFQLALTNRVVAGVETMFIMTAEEYGFTSASLIREIARYGGDLSRLVPDNVQKRLREKFPCR